MAQAFNDTLDDAMARNPPHLRRYVDQFRRRYGKLPEFHAQLSRDMKDIPYPPNILYPVGDPPIFVHIFTDPPATAEKKYIVIEPPRIQSVEEEQKYNMIRDKILEMAPSKDIPEEQEEFERFLDALFDEAVLALVKSGKGGGGSSGRDRSSASPRTRWRSSATSSSATSSESAPSSPWPETRTLRTSTS